MVPQYGRDTGRTPYGVESAAQTFFNRSPTSSTCRRPPCWWGGQRSHGTPCRRAACVRRGVALPSDFRFPRYYVSVDSSAYSYLVFVFRYFRLAGTRTSSGFVFGLFVSFASRQRYSRSTNRKRACICHPLRLFRSSFILVEILLLGKMQIKAFCPRLIVSFTTKFGRIYMARRCRRRRKTIKCGSGAWSSPLHAAAFAFMLPTHGFRSLRTVAVVRRSWRIRAATSPHGRLLPRPQGARSFFVGKPFYVQYGNLAVGFHAAHPVNGREPIVAALIATEDALPQTSGMTSLAGSRSGKTATRGNTPLGRGSTITQLLNLPARHGPQPGRSCARPSS